MNNNKQRYDIIVMGAGFAGTLTAIALYKSGFKVGLIERDRHPRFAIGESSTPVADMILRDLADTYDLPWLRPFSRYGSWQRYHPEIVCGKKRGFSYFKHVPGKKFCTDKDHSRELLVAASVSDERSDTNWLRSGFDAFLVEKVGKIGIPYLDQTSVTEMTRKDGSWNISADQNGIPLKLTSEWIIDATGSGGAVAKQLGIRSSAGSFHTNSYAVFSHLQGVKHWGKWLREQQIDCSDYPYNPDFSALHHLLEEGWIWMLRFNNNLTSSGIVFNGKKKDYPANTPAVTLWNETLSKYPSLEGLYRSAPLAKKPGRFIKTGRLQRKLERGAGRGWVALPHTIGFVDPLHSTGIAHTLSGVERVAYLFKTYADRPETLQNRLTTYEQDVFSELSFIDLLVSGCHDSTHHMELFTLYSMLYFTAAITYEQSRLQGNFDIETDRFLCAGDPDIVDFCRKRFVDIQTMLQNPVIREAQILELKEKVEQDIEPYNIAGLLRPATPNMYHHTAATL